MLVQTPKNRNIKTTYLKLKTFLLVGGLTLFSLRISAAKPPCSPEELLVTTQLHEFRKDLGFYVNEEVAHQIRAAFPNLSPNLAARKLLSENIEAMELNLKTAPHTLVSRSSEEGIKHYKKMSIIIKINGEDYQMGFSTYDFSNNKKVVLFESIHKVGEAIAKKAHHGLDRIGLDFIEKPENLIVPNSLRSLIREVTGLDFESFLNSINNIGEFIPHPTRPNGYFSIARINSIAKGSQQLALYGDKTQNGHFLIQMVVFFDAYSLHLSQGSSPSKQYFEALAFKNNRTLIDQDTQVLSGRVNFRFYPEDQEATAYYDGLSPQDFIAGLSNILFVQKLPENEFEKRAGKSKATYQIFFIGPKNKIFACIVKKSENTTSKSPLSTYKVKSVFGAWRYKFLDFLTHPNAVFVDRLE